MFTKLGSLTHKTKVIIGIVVPLSMVVLLHAFIMPTILQVLCFSFFGTLIVRSILDMLFETRE